MKMKKAVNMWKLDLPELYQMLVIMLIAEIFGIVLVRIIVSVDPAVEGYPLLGSFFAMCLGMFVKVMSCGFSYGSKFNLAVSMGCTRKIFFAVHWIGTILFVFIEIVTVLILGLLETGLGKIMYADTFLSEGLNLLPYLMDYRVIIALLLFVPAFGVFIGILMLKFQTKVLWALWVIWMTVFLGGAKVSDVISENPDSMLANIVVSVFTFFKTITGPVLLLLFFAVCAVMFVVSAALLQKQEVR